MSQRQFDADVPQRIEALAHCTVTRNVGRVRGPEGARSGDR